MIKKTIKYVNLYGTEVVEDLYFNLSAVEQARLEAKYVRNSGETLQDYLNKVIASQDIKKILAIIEDFILTAYGERAADGRGFEKSHEIRERFSNSIPYAELFEQIINDPKVMSQLINGAVEKTKKVDNQVSMNTVQ